MLPSQRDIRSASEYPKTLAQWLELDYFRRPRSLRVVRRRVGWIVLIVCAVVTAVVAARPSNQRAFQAGPVSTAHAMFNDDCAACHTTPFATARRLLTSNDAVRSVSDDACQRCHEGAIHHARQSSGTSCAECHREHRGKGELAHVDDLRCTACHADLKHHTDMAGKPDQDRTFRDVSAFLGGAHPHPPFALSEHPFDPGTIRFNHAKHLAPEGVLVPGSSQRRVLRCTDCHEPDSARRYMKPIAYERHCRECHALPVRIFEEYPAGPIKAAADQFREKPAPHPQRGEDPETVRAVLRDRFLAFARRFPGVHEGKTEPLTWHPVLKRPLSERDARITSESAWAERQLTQAERLLFEGASGCRYCHQQAQTDSNGGAKIPSYLPPRTTERWLPHSVFSHEAHVAIDCQQCHAGAQASRATSDVLMPKLATCQQCHNGREQGARTDCAECHVYHDPAKPLRPDRSFAIEDFLKGNLGRAGKSR